MMSVTEPLLKGLHKKWVKSVVKVCFGDFRNFDQFYLQKIPLYAKTFIIICCKVEARKICNFFDLIGTVAFRVKKHPSDLWPLKCPPSFCYWVSKSTFVGLM